MKEIREEVNKGKKLPKETITNPYIFVGLPPNTRGRINQESLRLDVETGDVDELEVLLNIVTEQTGYSATQLRQKNKGKIGLSTTRQAFMIAAYEAVANKSTVGRFINRDHSNVVYTYDTVRERIGMVGYELLTTIYINIKELFDARKVHTEG